MDRRGTTKKSILSLYPGLEGRKRQRIPKIWRVRHNKDKISHLESSCCTVSTNLNAPPKIKDISREANSGYVYVPHRLQCWHLLLQRVKMKLPHHPPTPLPHNTTLHRLHSPKPLSHNTALHTRHSLTALSQLHALNPPTPLSHHTAQYTCTYHLPTALSHLTALHTHHLPTSLPQLHTHRSPTPLSYNTALHTHCHLTPLKHQWYQKRWTCSTTSSLKWLQVFPIKVRCNTANAPILQWSQQLEGSEG